LRFNYFEKRGDVYYPTNIIKNPLHVPIGSITMSKTKALKKTMNGLFTKVLARTDFENPLEHKRRL